MYGWTAVQRYLRGGSVCAQQYNADNPGVMNSLLDVAVNVSQTFLQMLPAQLQVGSRMMQTTACNISR